ncbi:MAG: TCR/Tet family MFS transporter [Alphaproteobacteria bacterium]|nr:TCR/Tet family MFS transporter [Alphaproteobacteria bacterium]
MALSSASSLSSPGKFGKNAFFFVIVTVFIDMMAFAVIMPSMPFLMSELTGLPIEDVVPWGGYITVVYAIMNFITQPILGNLSDRFGRRPILLISMGTLAIDFLIMGFAHSIWLLFLGRFLSGLSGATHSTAAAYIADTTEPENRAKAFGMLGAAFGLGFILGPVIGGLLGQIDPRAPFFAAAGLAGLNFLYGMFVLPESLDREHRRPFDWKRANAFGAFKHFSKIPHLAWFIVAMGFYGFAHWVYPATFSYFGPIKFGWDAQMTGLALGAVGVGSALVQGGLIGPAMKTFGATRLVFFGFIVTAVTFVCYAIATESWMIFAIIPLGALAGLIGPAMNQIMTARVARNAQGELQGALASVQALGNVFSPVLMTQTLFYFTHSAAPVYFPGAAFALAAVITALAIFPLIKGLQSTPKIADPAIDGPGLVEAPAAAETAAVATP